MASVALFIDVDSDTVAFNHNGALFFNLRYFMQVSRRQDFAGRAVYWFVTMAHELAHNESSEHDLAHERVMEDLIAVKLPVRDFRRGRTEEAFGGRECGVFALG